MTPQEAIETIKVAIAEVEWNYPMNYAVAFEKAIEALEKQIPINQTEVKRVITKDRLLNSLFAQIQTNSETVHFGGYKNWCLSGSEVEQAINDIFAQEDIFKPTFDCEVDLI